MKDFDLEILEQMAKRFNPLPTGDEFLDSRYEWQKNENGSEWPYYRFFYHLASILRPKVILELGGFQGTAAAHFAKGWPSATVITIDHHSDSGDDLNRTKMLEACNSCHNLIYLQGWTTAKAAERNKGLHALGNMRDVYQEVIDHTLYKNNMIDILFIDSWHHYKYAKEDWNAYASLLAYPSLIICDDIIDGDDPDAPIYGMMKFWEEMPSTKFLNSNLHPGSNMGFVKV
jgi:predicted O-methyltransferase YrrM